LAALLLALSSRAKASGSRMVRVVVVIQHTVLHGISGFSSVHPGQRAGPAQSSASVCRKIRTRHTNPGKGNAKEMNAETASRPRTRSVLQRLSGYIEAEFRKCFEIILLKRYAPRTGRIAPGVRDEH
jgi:hypothetical protein